MSVLHVQKVVWNLDDEFLDGTREKRRRKKESRNIEEPQVLTKRLDLFFNETQPVRELCQNSSLVWIPFRMIGDEDGNMHPEFRWKNKFVTSLVNTAIKFARVTIPEGVFPDPRDHRHIYCTQEVLKWNDSYGSDTRTITEVFEELSEMMNTSVTMIQQNYLLCLFVKMV